MRNWMQSQVYGTAVLAALILAACGTSKESAESQSKATGTINTSNLPQIGSGNGSAGNLTDATSVSSTTLAAITGNYVGSLSKSDYYSGQKYTQSYRINLTMAHPTNDPSKTYPYIRFDSPNPDDRTAPSSGIGSIHAEGYMGMSLNNLYGFLFSFASTVMSIPQLSDDAVSIKLDLAVRNGNQFDPTWSKVSILDCGFTGGVVCSNTVQDVSFGYDLSKR